jgi:hypothetical protein
MSTTLLLNGSDCELFLLKLRLLEANELTEKISVQAHESAV